MKQQMLGFKFQTVLDKKTAALCMLAASVAFACSGCTEHHVAEAREAGASEDEIRHTIGLTMRVGAGRVKTFVAETLGMEE